MYSPKRKVKSNGKTVVGQLSSIKRAAVQFESGLEEAFLYILHFDSDVKSFHDQPVQIKYNNTEGKSLIYTPDYLVEYKNRNPALFEVKSQEFIKKNGAEIELKSNVAKQFASGNSWEFNLITDKEINTVYGENVRFLYRYQTYYPELAIINAVMAKLLETGPSTPNLLVNHVSSDSNQWPAYIAALWTLVLNKQIGCDLFKKIHMETPIWIPGPDKITELKYPYL